jgi:hypothetical protein
MRNITVSVSEETYTMARVWAAQRDTSLSAVVDYLLRTLPNIQRVINSFPTPTISKPVSKTLEFMSETSNNSTIFTQKVTPNEPFQTQNCE